MIEQVAFLGLGVMGFPMAGHLQRAGLEVTVYNRTGERAAAWQREFGGRVAATPAAAAAGAQLVLSCVGRDADVREIALGTEGALAAMVPGATFVDHTTASAGLARDLDQRCRELGLGFLDAPVSGGEQGARQGRLTLMCGGDPATFSRAEPVLQHYARAVQLLGPAGSGQLCKMVNQICIAGVIEGLAEGIHFARRAGLDPEAVIQVIAQGAAQSWQMEHRHATMIKGEYRHGFAVDWMRKDLEIVLAEARRNGARLPVAALVDQFYADVQAAGGGRWDTSSLLTRLEPRGAADCGDA